ncbi:MerR family transcriptional regulator [Paracoccus aurantiacus]|uniref:MerR family transcriptional regulator n=1 Tax=Paracoccus aurantiacus TaxID=2599412 RepID=A0A5C6S440_9RHOB|nr:MerR family transcriptional regulator [Paracoccus aurantiacus]TXB68750.1 MerR family transcriptional regulator [Paracoccus aurantiacus]
MKINEAATELGISPRILRHYENAGLIMPSRDANGYRSYAPADLRRAGRIRDMIATGFSTREILAMAPCLTDEGAGACTAGLADLEHKLDQMDRLIADLRDRRQATLDRIDSFRRTLSPSSDEREKSGHDLQDPYPVSDRLSGGKR